MTRSVRATVFIVRTAISCAMLFIASSHGQSVQLSGHMRPEFVTSPTVGALPAKTMLQLAIGLPLRNSAGLKQLIADTSDPKGARYRHYLTPQQFAEQFGPTAEDYEKVLAFARASRLVVTQTYANRIVIDVTANASAVQKAFSVKLMVHKRMDGSEFFALDRDPSVPSGLPVLHVAGLDNYVIPKPTLTGKRIGTVKLVTTGVNTRARVDLIPGAKLSRRPNGGSGTGGLFGGNDFRNAYALGVTANGANQSVGLMEPSGYFYASDITKYESLFGLPPVPLQIVYRGLVVGTDNEIDEVSLDIEMALAMAPGLSKIVIYEGGNIDSLLAAMASPPDGVPLSSQLSASWTYPVDETSQELVDEMASQGQSFFNSSGDNGSYPADTGDDRDMSGITIVGGTALSMNGLGASWSSETAWFSCKSQSPNCSGGGVESGSLQPGYQAGLQSGANGASSNRRNLPDVAMIAQDVLIVSEDGSLIVEAGTSVASPLWAAYTSLVNQQADNSGVGLVGFINPEIYAIGNSPPAYATNFHDIVGGSNGSFNAVAGYDLVTGWGSPQAALISTLSQPPPGTTLEGFTCSVFDSGYANLVGPSDAVFINQNKQACIPDGGAGTCRRWFGRCSTTQTHVAVNFLVFDDGYANLAGPSDAVFINDNNQACIPDGGAGTCRRWFGLPVANDGRGGTCTVFGSGYTDQSKRSNAIFVNDRQQLCVPNIGSGVCQTWWGRCNVN